MTFNPDNPDEHRVKPKDKPKAPRSPADGPHPKARALEWQQGSRWHLITGCGLYTVSKALVRGVPRYDAWFRPTGKGADIPYLLGSYHTVDDAKAKAQEHMDLTGGVHPSRPGKVASV